MYSAFCTLSIRNPTGTSCMYPNAVHELHGHLPYKTGAPAATAAAAGTHSDGCSTEYARRLP